MKGKHASRVEDSAGNDLRVRFSPEVLRQFARLEAAVHDSPHFGPEMLLILRDLAEGKATDVRSTLLGVAAVVQETGRHIRETGDKKADETLEALIEEFSNIGEGREPITVTGFQSERKVGRAK
jgi:hypothetical protein